MKNEPNISIDRGNRISQSFETIVKSVNKHQKNFSPERLL